MEKLHAQLDSIRSDLDKFPQLKQLQNQTGVDKLYLVIAGSIAFLAFLFIGFGAGLLCNLAGFVYPAYSSFKAIETKCKKDDVQWLTYWVVYACFNIIEVFVDFLLYWVPFYYAFKLGFLLWLFMPSTLGASFLYYHFLAPFLTEHESRIDKAMKEVAENSGTIIEDISTLSTAIGHDLAKSAAAKILEKKME